MNFWLFLLSSLLFATQANALTIKIRMFCDPHPNYPERYVWCRLFGYDSYGNYFGHQLEDGSAGFANILKSKDDVENMHFFEGDYVFQDEMAEVKRVTLLGSCGDVNRITKSGTMTWKEIYSAGVLLPNGKKAVKIKSKAFSHKVSSSDPSTPEIGKPIEELSNQLSTVLPGLQTLARCMAINRQANGMKMYNLGSLKHLLNVDISALERFFGEKEVTEAK